MIVYADVLIFLNLIINYFLLLGVSKLARKNPKTVRLVLGAFFGAVSSLYIFLPPLKPALEIMLKISVCFLMCLITFGFCTTRIFLKCVGLLFGVTAGFGGVMYAVWLIFSPDGMVINNSVVYFDISLIALLGFTVLSYLIFSIGFKIFSHVSPLAQTCEVTVFAGESSISLKGIVDTGNSIEDVFSLGEIIICEKRSATQLFGEEDFSSSTALKTRYRLLPCATVSGADILEGIRCDRAEVRCGEKKVILNRPILAFSKTALKDSEAIINPKILG